MNKNGCNDTNLNSIENEPDCGTFGNGIGDPCNPCKKVDPCDPCNSGNVGKQSVESSCNPCRSKDNDLCRSRSVSFSQQQSTHSIGRDANTAQRTHSKEKTNRLERTHSRSSNYSDDARKVNAGGRGFINSDEGSSQVYSSSTDEVNTNNFSRHIIVCKYLCSLG